MTGQTYINNKDIYTTFGATLIDNSFTNLLLDGDLKEDASNNLRSQPGEQLFIENTQPEARNVEITFLVECDTMDEFLTKYKALKAEIDNGMITLKVIPLKEIYTLRRKSYLSLDSYRSGSTGKLVVNFREPNPKNRIQL